MSEPALNALIVSNIKDLDAAAQHLSITLQAEVGAALDAVADRARGEAGWDGESDWYDDGITLAPKTWRLEGGADGGHRAEFWLTHDVDELGDQDHFWLTQLLGKGHARLGFRWSRLNVTKARWKKALAQKSEFIEEARKRGFTYFEKDGSFFLPVIIDADQLAAALAEETPEQALAPFETALRTLVEAEPFFDRLLAAVVID